MQLIGGRTELVRRSPGTKSVEILQFVGSVQSVPSIASGAMRAEMMPPCLENGSNVNPKMIQKSDKVTQFASK